MIQRTIGLLFLASVHFAFAENGKGDNSLPRITSPEEIEIVFGEAFRYSITAGGESVGYSVQNAPVWVNREGAELSGRALSLGTFQIQLNAVNLNGVSAPFFLKVHVISPGHEQN